MRGKKIDADLPPVLNNANELGQQADETLVSPLERYYNNHPLKEGRSYKLLGIYLDEHLSLNLHTDHIISKLSRSLYCIKQAKNIIPGPGMKALYFSLIHSHLVYCSSLMSLHCKSEAFGKHFYQVYGTLQSAMVPCSRNIIKKA